MNNYACSIRKYLSLFVLFVVTPLSAGCHKDYKTHSQVIVMVGDTPIIYNRTAYVIVREGVCRFTNMDTGERIVTTAPCIASYN